MRCKKCLKALRYVSVGPNAIADKAMLVCREGLPTEKADTCTSFDEDLKAYNDFGAVIPVFLMLIGIPGSGKSSWLKNQQLEGFEVICPDQIRKESFGNISDQANNIAVWNSALARTCYAFSCGHSVILDATNVNTRYRREFVSQLPRCKLKAKIFRDDPQTCYERISKDLQAGRDRSAVPEETVYRMYGELLYTIKVIQSEGFEIVLGV